MIEIIAWILIVLCGISVLGTPLLFGETKIRTYDYPFWLQQILSATLIVLVCARVLGWL